MYQSAFVLWFDHFLDSGAKTCQIFRWFFWKCKKKSEKHSVINWPLKIWQPRPLFRGQKLGNLLITLVLMLLDMPRTFLMTEQGHLFKEGWDMIVKTQTLSREVLMGVALWIQLCQMLVLTASVRGRSHRASPLCLLRPSLVNQLAGKNFVIIEFSSKACYQVAL